MTSMSQAVLSNHFLGKGTVQKADRAFELTFGRKGELLALVSSEGRLLCLDIDPMSYAVEERFRLSATDHVIAAFIVHPDETLLVLTQTGKALQRTRNDLEPARSPQAKGQALIPEARLEQGVRAIGAAAMRDSDQVVILHADGKLTRHAAGQLAGAGAVPTGGQLLAFTVHPALGGGK
jgi:DNA gyrase/topoisomerase IV subunit A